jgi:hypothetical protein
LQRSGVRLAARPFLGEAGEVEDRVELDRVRSPAGDVVRAWVKVKNRSYWRYELEREGAFRRRKPGLTSS